MYYSESTCLALSVRIGTIIIREFLDMGRLHQSKHVCASIHACTPHKISEPSVIALINMPSFKFILALLALFFRSSVLAEANSSKIVLTNDGMDILRTS